MALAMVIIAWLGLQTPQACAAELDTPLAFWVDESGEADLTAALAAAGRDQFTSFQSLLSLGYQPAPVWIKLSLPAGEAGADDWVLRLRPPWHDEIALYDPLVSSDARQVTGDRYPHSADAYQSLNLNFLLPQTAESRSVFLRLETPHSVLLSVEVMPQLLARSKDQRQLAYFMFYVAFLIFVLLASCFVLMTDREPVIAAFCFQLLLAIIYAASMYGLARWLLDGVVGSALLNQINYLLILAYPTATVLFYRVFFSDYGLRPVAARVIEFAIMVGAVNIGLVLFGQVHAALKLNALVLSLVGLPLLLSPWLFFDLGLSPHPNRLPVWLVRLVVTVLIGFSFLGIQRTLGWTGGSEAALNGFLLHAFLLALLMSAALRYRAFKRRRALLTEAMTQQQRADKELFARQNLERFLSMFSHEVRTPLSAVSVAVERGISDQTLAAQAGQAVDAINRLVQRCLQVDQAEAEALPLEVEQVDLGEVVLRCINRLDASGQIQLKSASGILASADSWMAETIVANLIDNAIKYGSPDAPISIKLMRCHDGSVKLTICNQVTHGQDLDVQKLFDKFYRSPRAARTSGAGLGLYLAKNLAEQQQGGLTASWCGESELCVELSLPDAHLPN